MWILLLVLFEILVGVIPDRVIRQYIAMYYATNTKPREYVLFTIVHVDDQPVNMVVDTGTNFFLLLEQSAYEKLLGHGACEMVFSRCYDCQKSCQPINPKTIYFADGRSVKAFRRYGSLRYGVNWFTISFGLEFEFSPSPAVRNPPAPFGLGPTIDVRFPSVLEQLVTQSPKAVKENTFALYLKPGPFSTSHPVGELLLGGGDDSLYEGPLQFVPMVDRYYWKVGLTEVQIDSDKTVDVAGRVHLDTGSNYILVPQNKLMELITSIQWAVSKAAAEAVHFMYDEELSLFQVNCDYRRYMPTLRFMLSTPNGNVPLNITHEGYVPVRENLCYLMVKSGVLTLPNFMLVRNYLEFQLDQKRIGIAKLKLADNS
ncbi:hypothetical protein FOL47_007738 [Perkinsus chesapeaki]|uniref:Peptidase A1 domain-containing protein n=1 Tax=Perkinsus chesapeaki TaxID=330153 RepID=A0A7J6LJG4_PERCH|nr:hypothetical protein FOL47_007738 [Perkinsus chesapeaki]